MFAVNVFIKGTSLGTRTDFDGNYKIENIASGEYSIEFSYIGFEKKLFTGIKFSDGENKILSTDLNESALTVDQDIVIIGERPLIDVEDGKNTKTIGSDVIEIAPVKSIENILNSQTGIVQNPEGIHIRGGRTYETGFLIDGVSAQDPLAGTGFGIDLGTNAIDDIEITTSGSNAEYGDATSGIINTKTKEGGDKFSLSFSHKRDNFGFNSDWSSSWNSSVYELGMGGTIEFPFFIKENRNPDGTKQNLKTKKLRYFISLKNQFTDEFIKNPADQVTSSVYPDKFFSPFQDNRWAGLLKLNYEIDPRKKITFSYLKSLTINQNTNMLRVTGNDVTFRPGYQYLFELQPDNANTYTHDTNLENLQWQHTPFNQFSYKINLSRLFVHLRADANGRPWRPDSVATEFDPQSIVEFPTQAFNPDDSIVFVLPPPGLYNNGGIATLWHDHFLEELTSRFVGTFYSQDLLNRFSFGAEIKKQDMQWIDIYRPWIGAPIILSDGDSSQSFRLGDMSDIWHVKPLKGSFFLTDKYKFRGLNAELGLRMEYWFPGKYVDDAVMNPAAPIAEEFRNDYPDEAYSLFGRRFKMRLLPKISASFPIRENQMMYFSYSHSTVQPHPSYIYAGLDPFYQDRSTLSKIGNPTLDPEVDISYEIGLKSQITSNDALNGSAFWKDKYDFITTSTILIPDATGRDISRSININSDYARVRGIEVEYIKRIKKWFYGQLSASYSIATGQSSSSSETIKEILATGNRGTTKENFLAWDSPLDLKAYGIFTRNDDAGLFGKKWLNKMSVYLEAIYRSGRRHTPYILDGYEGVSGRPIYVEDSGPENRYAELGASSYWVNMTFRKWWQVKSKVNIAFTIEVTNLLNTKNAAIINPVTGDAYIYGDAVPTEWRDPVYQDPRDPRSSGTPPFNPSRYYENRHLMVGLSVNF